MSHLVDDPRTRGTSSATSSSSSSSTTTNKSPTLPERVAQFYYAHGLFCSTYPTTVIFIAITITSLCCYPLVNVPFPGNPPIHIPTSNQNTSNSQLNEQPWCYIQQVVLRTAVIPWDDDLYLVDAFRAPLYEAFKLLEIVRNFQDPHSLKTLGHVCLHVETIRRRDNNNKNNVLPEYSCLVLSPANLWGQDVQKFSQDSSILNTIYGHQNLQKGKTSIAEMLFGMHLTDTGIKRYPLRNRQRILQYAITMYMKEYDEGFVSGLRHKLYTLYPLHQDFNNTVTVPLNILNNTILIHYAGDVNYLDYVGLIASYCLLFFYYYFSVRKMEVIKSKLGMAFTAVVTVLGSLHMTLGICFFFGLTLSMQGKEIFPYLVILVGLENVLVLTKSVVSTPEHLDIKIRVAQGLSKEGWSTTKNFLIEITIMTMGLFTFVPVIQEFCIFSIVGLISDFFLQMLFFSTVLGIDTRRTENLVEKTNCTFRNTLYQSYYDKGYPIKGTMHRSKSHPRLSATHADVVAKVQDKKIPKRLRLVNIWARTRFFQRAFSILMVIWISKISYNSGILEHYFMDLNEKQMNEHNIKSNMQKTNIKPITLLPTLNSSYIINYSGKNDVFQYNYTEDLTKLKHSEYAPWLRLSTRHWASILNKYNVSVSGKTVAVLPSITISQAVSPEQAELLRNPSDKSRRFQWHALAAALDPIDFNDIDGTGGSGGYHQSDRPFYPTSPMEIFLTTILCVISVIVLAYAVVVLYKCICSRNYAEWRSSWKSEKSEEKEVPLLFEPVPVILDGHQQEVECIATDGFSLVSCCLGGQLKVWDSTTGVVLAHINRNKYFTSPSKSSENCNEVDDNNFSDYESGSPPSRDEYWPPFPSVQHKINTNFSNLKLSPVIVSNNKDCYKFDFGDEYREIYKNHDKELRMRHKTNETSKWVNRQRSIEGPLIQQDKCIDIPKTRSCDKLHSNTNLNSKTTTNLVNDFGNVGNSPVWCLDYLDNLIVVGCANGRLEFWEGTTGKLKCIFEDSSGVGITCVKLVGSRVIAARLYGTLDLFQLQTYNQGKPIDWNFTSAYRRTHIRTGSAGSITDYNKDNVVEVKEDLRCLKVNSNKVHQQPITCLDSEGGKIVTGSQDHTLKVFRLDDGSPLYTLHGHYGPIMCLFIDRVSPATAGSGSQDGTLCVWDLSTGACMYSIHAHDGSITSLTYSPSYVISLGSDGRICVWERFQGHLLNTIHVSHTFTSQILMLSPHLLITTRSGDLVIYDVQTGDTIRTISLGHSPIVFIKQLIMLRDAVLCDFGNQLRIVRFPLITHKSD